MKHIARRYQIGVRLKLDRAQEHFDCLDKKFRTFFTESNAYEVVAEVDPNGWKIARVKVNKMPPLTFGVIVGDIGHNLRSALDQTIYGLARRTIRDPSRTQFPIYLDGHAYVAPRKDGRKSPREELLDGLTAGEKAIVDEYQPFQRGRSRNSDPLALLAWLTNTDKHKLVHPAYSRAASQNLAFTEVVPGTIDHIEMRVATGRAVRNGTELHRLRAWPDPKAKVKMEGNVAIYPTFGERRLRLDDVALIRARVLEIVGRLGVAYPA